MSAAAYDRLLDVFRSAGRTVKPDAQDKTARVSCPGPNHRNGDRNPSLSVGRGRGMALLFCHAGCEPQDVLSAVGLTMAELYDEPRKGVRHTYTDAQGTPVVTVFRKPDERKGKRISQRAAQVGEMAADQPRTLYRLPEVIAAVESGQKVYLCEGEKGAEALSLHTGVVATTGREGAAHIGKTDFTPLTGADVVAVVDRDKAGDGWAAVVAKQVGAVATNLVFVQAGAGHDAENHVAAGLGLDDFKAYGAPPPESGAPPPEFDAPGEPMKVARQLMTAYQEPDGRTVHAWRGGWMRWEQSHWIEMEPATLRSQVYKALEPAVYDHPKNGTVPWAPTKKKIADVTEAMAAVAHLPEKVDPPAWIGDQGRYPADELVACRNGLLHVGSRDLLSHTVAYFNRVAVPFDYDPDATEPTRWLTFLDDLWPDDPDAVAALQEYFGYVLSGRTDQQKILLLIGPTRSGKGTIARVLTALVGRGNAAGPTLASLGTNFGLSPLLGKPLAVVSDARLDRSNSSAVVERLLSISGEDMLTVDRKYREPWTGKLPSRFVILSNELPRFGDASGAIAHRFIVLQMTRSFLGKENTRLTSDLISELPGILRWSLDGLDRLVKNGALTVPESSDDTIQALQDLVSPTAAFVRDRCRRGPGEEVTVNDLYLAFKHWCDDNSHKVPTVQTFGRDLRAVVPGIKAARPREGAKRHRTWQGIRLLTIDEEEDPSEQDELDLHSVDRGPSRTTGPSRPARSAMVRGPRTVEPTAKCPECGELFERPGSMKRCRSDHRPEATR